MQLSEILFNAVVNERQEYDALIFAIRQLVRTLDRTAERVAKANAEWHDDPEGDPEGYDDMHKPAIDQYPRQARDETIVSLVRHYLNEWHRQDGVDV